MIEHLFYTTEPGAVKSPGASAVDAAEQRLFDPKLVVVAVEMRAVRQGHDVLVATPLSATGVMVMTIGVLLALLVGHASGGDVRLEPHDGLDPRLLGRRVERDHPVHAPVVGDREGLHPLLGDAPLNPEWT
jgi:hypothetical protein